MIESKDDSLTSIIGWKQCHLSGHSSSKALLAENLHRLYFSHRRRWTWSKQMLNFFIGSWFIGSCSFWIWCIADERVEKGEIDRVLGSRESAICSTCGYGPHRPIRQKVVAAWRRHQFEKAWPGVYQDSSSHHKRQSSVQSGGAYIQIWDICLSMVSSHVLYSLLLSITCEQFIIGKAYHLSSWWMRYGMMKGTLLLLQST